MFLKSSPRSSKFLYISYEEHAGDNKTTSPIFAYLVAISTASLIVSACITIV